MSELEIPEAKELKELEEHSHDKTTRRIGLLISILAIILAICGALGRKAENFVIVSRVDASNTWAYFQAKKLRAYQSETTHDLALIMGQGGASKQQESARQLAERYEEKRHKYDEESEKIAKQAEGYSEDAEKWEHRANRFSMSEIFLQIGVVLCSIAILTQMPVFVAGGLGFAAIGISFALSVLLIH